MTPWKLSLYSPRPGISPVRDWYYEQSDPAIIGTFDAVMGLFQGSSDLAEPRGVTVRPLQGKYLGLHEILVTVDLEDDQREFGVIGKYKLESNPEFVLFLVCDRFNDQYFSCLDSALDYAKEWVSRDPRGDVHAYDLEKDEEE